jgi:hypothetical protein
MMEATYSTEISIDFQRTAGRYILEDRNVLNYFGENFKSYIYINSKIQMPTTWYFCGDPVCITVTATNLYSSLHERHGPTGAFPQ